MHAPTRHHEDHRLERSDIAQRVARDGNRVGLKAWRERRQDLPHQPEALLGISGRPQKGVPVLELVLHIEPDVKTDRLMLRYGPILTCRQTASAFGLPSVSRLTSYRLPVNV